MTHYAQDHLTEIARKSIQAENSLADMFMLIGGVTEKQAFDLVDFYQRKKMVKLDLTNARLTVKHGSYLDAEFIQHLAIHEAF